LTVTALPHLPRLLVIEKHTSTRSLIEHRFAGELSIESAATVQAALWNHHRNPFDLMVWDTISVPPECINTVRMVKKFLKGCEARMIVLANVKEPEIISIRNLRCEWLQQPVDESEFLALAETALHCKISDCESQTGHIELSVPTEFEGILAITLTMRSVVQHIMEAAGEDIPVLITGETGTGKDLAAAAIHKRSGRRNFPYVQVNMGAIASELVASELFGHERGAYTGASESRPGLFEQAQGGTILLDEITTMDEKTQVSLLRVLETKTVRRVRGGKDIHVDVRVIAATNENIEEAVKAGRFREDLYYRLDVFRIQLPPLRERLGAISLLADHFVAHFAESYRKEIRMVSRETYRLMRRYSWPGNVRELKNVIQRAVLLAKGNELTPDLLPHRIRDVGESETNDSRELSPIHLGMSLAEVEKQYIKMTLASTNGNKLKAASLLSISRRALYNKLRRFGVVLMCTMCTWGSVHAAGSIRTHSTIRGRDYNLHTSTAPAL
jgi:DNA-binding NtrC family response regulator